MFLFRTELFSGQFYYNRIRIPVGISFILPFIQDFKSILLVLHPDRDSVDCLSHCDLVLLVITCWRLLLAAAILVEHILDVIGEMRVIAGVISPVPLVSIVC